MTSPESPSAMEILAIEEQYRYAESISKPTPEGETPIFAIRRDRWFAVLKAFRVMRSLAARYRQDRDVRMKDGDLLVPMWGYLEREVDAEFEAAMNKE